MSTPKGETPAEYAKQLADVRDEVENYDHHWAAQNTLEWLLADRDRLAEALSQVTEEVEGLRKRAKVAKGKAAKYRGTTTEARCCGKAQAYAHAAEIIGNAL